MRHCVITALAAEQTTEQCAVRIADFNSTGSPVMLQSPLYLLEYFTLDDRLMLTFSYIPFLGDLPDLDRNW